MSDLPQGWRWSTVAELAERVDYGSSSKTTEDARGVPVLRMGNIREGRLALDSLKYLPRTHPEFPDLLLEPGDVLFNRTNSPELVGKSAVYEGEPTNCSFASYLLRLRLRDIHPRIFVWYVNSEAGRSWVSSVVSQQVGQANVNSTKLRAFRVPVPPLDVQRRIVAKLDALLAQTRAAREQLEAIPPLVEKYRQSVLAAAFRGDLTAEWRKKNANVEPASKLLERIRAERRKKWEEAELAKMKAKGKVPKGDAWKEKYVKPEPVDASELPELPPTWCWASLGEISPSEDGLVDGPFGSNLKSADYVDDGPVVIRLGNLRVGDFRTHDVARIPQKKFELLQRHEAVAGDLVLAALADPVGRCCEVPQDLGLAIVKADCVRLRPMEPVLRRFVMWSLNSPGALARAAGAGHGLGRERMNLSDIRAHRVPLAPLPEQSVLLRVVEALLSRAEGALTETTGAALQALESSLLAKAFSGELAM